MSWGFTFLGVFGAFGVLGVSSNSDLLITPDRFPNVFEKAYNWPEYSPAISFGIGLVDIVSTVPIDKEATVMQIRTIDMQQG